MDESKKDKQIMEMKVEGTTPRGRPRNYMETPDREVGEDNGRYEETQ